MINKKGGVIILYKLYVRDARTNEMIKKGEYQNKETAEKKVKKYKDREYVLFKYPKEIKVGMKVYKDDKLYGTITRLTDSFIYINKDTKNKKEVIFLADSFEDKFISGIFEFKEE